MRLSDDADVSNEVWDNVIDNMKQRVEDKVPAIRGFSVRALSRFANVEENGDIINLFLQALPQESNAVSSSHSHCSLHTNISLLLT